MWVTLVRILRIMKQIGFQKVYKWQTSLGLISTSFTTEPVTITARSTSSNTTTTYNTIVSTPYTTFTTTFSTDYSRSTSHSTTTTFATTRNTTYSVSTSNTTSETESVSTSRSTAYNTTRSTAYTTSYTTSRGTSRSTSRSTSYTTSRSTSYSTSGSRNTSYTTSWNYTASTSYGTSVSNNTSYSTTRYTSGGGGGGGGFGGGFQCFAEGTLVQISATEAVPIETLQVGSTILSKEGGFNTDEEQEIWDFKSQRLDGAATTTEVTVLKPHTSDKIISVNDGLLKATRDHMVIVRCAWGNNGSPHKAWRIRPLYACLVGDHFMDVAGKFVEITSLEELTGTFNIWEIDIEPADVFYAGGVLVHNHIKE